MTKFDQQIICRAGAVLRRHLLENDGPWSLAQRDGPALLTLDGTFDPYELARVVACALESPDPSEQG
jgi:hypothetical protein